MDCGVYAFGDIHEAVSELEKPDTKFPSGVIGIVSGYIHKTAKAAKSHSIQAQKISLKARPCRQVGLIVQAQHKMDVNFNFFEEDKVMFRVPVSRQGSGAICLAKCSKTEDRYHKNSEELANQAMENDQVEEGDTDVKSSSLRKVDVHADARPL